MKDMSSARAVSKKFTKKQLRALFVDSALWYGLRAGLMKMGIQ